MKKHLLAIGAFALILPATAQVTSLQKGSLTTARTSKLDLSGLTTFTPEASAEDASRAVTCVDRVTYTDRTGATAFYGHLGGDLGWEGLIQYFPDYAGQVTKVEFQAASFDGATKNIAVGVFNLTTGTALATGNTTVTSTTSGNITVTFASPATVPASADGFIVGIFPATINDSIQVFANANGEGMGYTSSLYDGSEYNWLDDGFDRDILVRPTVSFSAPAPTLTPSVMSACTGVNITFNGGFATTTPAHYGTDVFNPDGITTDLDFGDGMTSSSDLPVTHAYATAGTKTATLKWKYEGWTTDCVSDPATQNLTINASAWAFFSWESTGLSVEFTNLSTGATSYSWAFGDGGTATAPSPVHNYAADGTYTVELTATSSCGNDSEFTNISIATGTNGGNVGVVEMENGLLTNIYPNPASENLTVDLSLIKAEKVSLQVISSLGQVIYGKELGNITASVENIDLSAFEAGVYFVRIVHNGTVSSRTFVKQ